MNGYNGIDAGSVLTNRGLNDGFYGQGGQFANAGSNAVRINAGSRATAAGIENLLDQNQFSATNKNIVDGHSRICDNLNFGAIRSSDQFAALTKSGVDSEFRAIARENSIRAEMNANNSASVERDHRAEIALLECCCKAEATALAVESRRVRDDLELCRASKLDNKLDILLARTNS